MKTDTISHYLSPEGIRLTIADTSHAAGKAELIHSMPAISTMVLAKMMTGAAMLANDFKNHEGVSLKWITGGPAGEIHVDAYDGRYVRGYIEHPEQGTGMTCDAASEADFVSRKAQLFVTRYSLLKMPYTSAVNLQRGDISACLTEYLNTSEQVLSAVSLSVSQDQEGRILRSAGYLAQLLPQGNLQAFAEDFRQLDRWDAIAAEASPNSLAALIQRGKFELLEEAPLTFACTCSEERIRSTLVTLPPSEQENLLKENSIEIVCHYCGKKYRIAREVLRKWFEEEKGARYQ